MQKWHSKSRGFIKSRLPSALEAVSIGKTMSIFQCRSTYRILQENLQDPIRDPIGHRETIYKIVNGNLERKDQRLAS